MSDKERLRDKDPISAPATQGCREAQPGKPHSDFSNDTKVWFAEGLQFECSGCGDCCTGDPGYVWVNQQEIRDLAAAVGLSVEDFEATYIRQIGVRKSLTEYDNGDCVLFDPDKRHCTAYEARPRQCRTWPFWDSTVSTPEDWEETRRECPGCGKGPFVAAEEIVRRVNVIRV